MRPPRSLGSAVACVAAATLFSELALTRIFSVLLYYHFSFFAVALAMSGLALGGLWVARWPVRTMSYDRFTGRLADLALAGALIGLAQLALFALAPPNALSAWAAVLGALQWLPLFVASGAFLAAAFARRHEWIGELYGWDLAAAGIACIVTIPVFRSVAGPGALFAMPLLLATAAVLLRPAGLARRTAAVSIAVASGAALLLGSGSREPLIRLADEPPWTTVVFERWNEYSRIQGRTRPDRPDEVEFVIDRSAATQMPRVPAGENRPDAIWSRGISAQAYHLGRPLRRVAIVGIGGGRDFLPPLASGAQEIVGFEYNRIFIDLLQRDYAHFNAVAFRPEVRLVHGEGRVALRHHERRFDVVQASLTDTWAATAGGGLALAENGLYTIEGWATLLGALSPQGVLTMTRWYLVHTPVETHRLVALAAAALHRAGVADPRHHVLLVTGASTATGDDVSGALLHATIIVSPAPFTAAEVASVSAAAGASGFELLAEPRKPSRDAVISGLLDPARYAQTVAEHAYDVSPPTDVRPYFFLQLRIADIARMLVSDQRSALTDVSLHAVRVLVALVVAAFCLTAVVLMLSRGPSRNGRTAEPAALRLYFVLIGLGYMLVQLALHQRLTIALGQPTYTLAVVLFAMLVGTGIGSISSRWFRHRPDAGWLVILVTVGGALLAFQVIPELDRVSAEPVRLLLVGGGVMVVGTALGLGFPLGVRLAAPHGDGAIQRMWAVNGAASIAGSGLAALIGLGAGSRATLVAGLACYLLASTAGAFVYRNQAIFKP
ncbi:MAG: hypothetical protein ACREOC_06970 [Gemmatimonadales bacterium]